MPAALTELRGVVGDPYRRATDLTGMSEARIQVGISVVGFAGAKFRGQYSTDSGASWNYFDSDGADSGPSVPIDSLGLAVSAWVDIDAAAIGEVWTRIVGIDGDGAVDPQFALLELQYR